MKSMFFENRDITKAYRTMNESYDDMETADYGGDEHVTTDWENEFGKVGSAVSKRLASIPTEDKDEFVFLVLRELSRRMVKGETDGKDEKELILRDGCYFMPELEAAMETSLNDLIGAWEKRFAAEGGKEGVKKADVAESGDDIENEFTAMSDDELERAHLNAIRTRSVDLEAIRDEIARREAEADKKSEF